MGRVTDALRGVPVGEVWVTKSEAINAWD